MYGCTHACMQQRVRVGEYVYVSIDTCESSYVCMYARKYAWMKGCSYTCMYVRMYVLK